MDTLPAPPRTRDHLRATEHGADRADRAGLGATSAARVALLSIHPQYAQAILDGTKRVEFRKRALAPATTHVAVYATRPVRAIVGVFEIDGQETASPSELWRRYRDVGRITRADYRSYYAGKTDAVGIKVGAVAALSEPVQLNRLGDGYRAPQSFTYLTPHQVIELELPLPSTRRICSSRLQRLLARFGALPVGPASPD